MCDLTATSCKGTFNYRMILLIIYHSYTGTWYVCWYGATAGVVTVRTWRCQMYWQGARWIVAGMIRRQPQYALRTSPRSCVTVARNSSSSKSLTLNVQAQWRLARVSSARQEPIRPNQVRYGNEYVWIFNIVWDSALVLDTWAVMELLRVFLILIYLL